MATGLGFVRKAGSVSFQLDKQIQSLLSLATGLGFEPR
ncbi:MAG: hypothetical protein UX78_C0013G0019 [Candidatus Amesbacteria bacterium GW2011_GWA2_47_11]|uniref:Uncharacterized protein n=1 Tax=Candidatus Amesbacteria bacterium GW2011_GWA2_47_11 TaxID=1618357 RepID=A0A0G1TPD8_9BACT|nr:MAG: hypothetical protein UX78_C0013G0019 [Candidatus Amesbacteria bacterium GW2011_GWA2_47_11]